MLKKLFFLSLLIPLFLVTTGGASPDGLAQLEQAKTYQKSREYTKAEEIYQSILKEYPGTDYALKAQKGLVTIYIDSRNEAQAKAAFDKLIADFPKHPDLPGIIFDVGRKYEGLKKYEEAKRFYQYVIEKYPDNKYALKVPLRIQRNFVFSSLESGDDVAAETALSKLITDFSDHPELPWAVYTIATKYEAVKEHEKAKELYQKVIEKYPDSKYAVKARIRIQRRLILSYIDSGNYTEAKAALDKLITDFPTHPDLPWVVYNIAIKYERVKEYEKAKEVYQKVIEKYPDSKYVVKARIRIQRRLILSYIDSGNYTEAKAALDKLITDFPKHPDLPWAVYSIAIKYERVKEYEKTKKVYQKVIEKYPDNKYAVKARIRIQRRLILSRIDSGNYTEAETALSKLITDFSEHPDFPWAVYTIAAKYEDAKKYEKAKKIYQYIIEKYPDSEYAVKAQVMIPALPILSYISLGNDAAAESSFDKLLTDFAGHPELYRAINRIEEEYYNKILAEGKCALCSSTESVYFKKAVEMWEKVMGKFPDFFYNDPDLYLFIGTSYTNLGEYEKARDCYQKIIDNFPQCKHASTALFHIIQSYERLKDLGVISESEADLKIEEPYKRLIEKYSTTHDAVMIHVSKQRRLAISYSESGNEAEAKRVFKKLISELENVVSLTADKNEKMFTTLKIAEVYLAAKDYSNAREELKRILNLYPNTFAAGRARLMLIGMDTFKLR